MAVLEDPDLTAGLRELARHQPPQPDRMPALASRVRRVRRRRAAMAVAAVLAVSGVPAAVLTRSPAPVSPPAVLAGATPLQQWPDRSRPARRELGEAAVRAWLARDDVPDPSRVQWLFRGVVPLDDDAGAYVVVFLGGPGQARQLVTGQVPVAGTTLLPERELGWGFRAVAAATAGPPGVHLADRDPDHGTSTALVLADPAARELTWSVRSLPGTPGTAAPSSGAASSPDGVFTVTLPPLDGRVAVRTSGPGLSPNPPRLLGDGVDPRLVLPDELALPDGVEEFSTLRGQSDRQEDGAYTVSGLDDERGWPTGALAFGTCYGEAPLVVALQGRRTTVPCDGRTHPAGDAGPAARMRVIPLTQGLLAYRLALANR